MAQPKFKEADIIQRMIAGETLIIDATFTPVIRFSADKTIVGSGTVNRLLNKGLIKQFDLEYQLTRAGRDWKQK
jgi:hypothetical protein